MYVVGVVIEAFFYVFILLLTARLVMSVVQNLARGWAPRGFLLVFLDVIYSVTDPPTNLVRRVIPPLRLGQLVLDIGFILVLVLAIVLQRVNQAFLLS